MRKIYVIGALALLFSACKPSVSIITAPTAGPTVKFTNYLAIGDNYTGGYIDGSLTVTGQLNSFPQRLFEQFSQVPEPAGAKGPFIHPLLHSDYGYPTAKLVLGYTHSTCIWYDSSLAPISYPYFTADPIDDQKFVSNKNNGQINNIGVLGLRVVDYPVTNWALAADGQGIPYARRFFYDPAATPQDELQHRVDNLYPTFFTMWLGMNDVLLYAMNGGQGDGTGNALPMVPGLGIYNPNDISPIGVFDSAYDKALNTAIFNGASGALINIPDISLLPYFNAIPSDGLILDRQGQADTLLAYYAGQAWKKVFQPGKNQFIIKDHNDNVRQSVPGELISLKCPIDSIKCAGWGSTKPIPNIYVLTTDEIQYIRAAVDRYNYFISTEAQLHHLAYVDMNAYFKTLPTGAPFNGISYSNAFVSGGFFSLDGIHPTPRGQALIANKIIETVNRFYKSTLNPVDANKYHGVEYP